MKNKIDIGQANPFVGFDNVIDSISDVQNICTKIEFKSENGLVVTLPNNDTSLLLNSTSEDVEQYNIDDVIDIYLDPKGNAYKNNWEYELYHNIISKVKKGHVFNAKVIDVTEHGLLVTIDGLQCFLPEGQIGLEKRGDLQTYIGGTIDVKLISIKLKENEYNRFLPIVSHRILVDEKNISEAQDKLREIEVGSIVQGTVKSIANYGVFVTLFPSVDGLIHITDLSWAKVSNPSDILSVGQKISVIILDIKQTNDGKYKIGLGLKQLTQKPWNRFDRNTKEGDIVSGTICNITDYGIFIMLPSGVQGLIHRTELSWDAKVTSRDFQKGETISAKIINIDWNQEKLLLSLKQMYSDPWSNIDKKYSVGDIVDVTIKRFTNLEIMVKIEEGINGLIHVSELSWTEEIKKPKDHYLLEDHLKAIILSIDKEKKKIELSHKQTTPNPWYKYTNGQQVKAIIVNVEKLEIQAKIVGENLQALIPANSIPNEISLEVNSELDCVIKEIDENKRRIILAIV